jgi:hypothetical protein
MSKIRRVGISGVAVAVALLSNFSSIGAIALEPQFPVAADTDPDYTCPNAEGICIRKIEQEEDRVSVTIHNNFESTAKKFGYVNLRYSGAGYSSGLIKLKPSQKSYTSKELKFNRPYKFEVRGCRTISSGNVQCTKWQSKSIKLQG